MESFVGDYESDEALAVLRVQMVLNKLFIVPEDRRSAAQAMTALFADTFRTGDGTTLH